MSVFGLALRNLAGSVYRSAVVASCVLLLAGFSLFSTLIIRGSEDSLRLALARLGADVVVVPAGVEGEVETALLMGKPVSAWMPRATLDRVANTPGVAVASPQLFLASLSNASCCAVSEMFLIAFDPETDFTIRPWLERELGKPLGVGEVIGGSYVFVPAGEDSIRLYNYPLTLRGNLEPTGSGLDQALFLTFETAHEMSSLSYTRAEKPLVIPPDSVSAVMVKVAPGADPRAIAAQIARELPGVSAIHSPDLFAGYRRQMGTLAQGFLAALGVAWVLSMVLIVLVFSIAAHERRRQLGVLRALGGSGGFVLRFLLAEAAILGLAAGVAGVALAALAAYLFRDLIVVTLGLPFLFPAAVEFLALAAAALALALGSLALATVWPALRASREEPALAMRG